MACGLAALCAVVSAAPISDAASRRSSRAPECPTEGTEAVSFQKLAEGGFLTAGGAEIRLPGVLASDVRGEALAALLASGPLRLAVLPEPDRYGRKLVNAFAGGVWVQGELLRRGIARASPDLANGICADAVLQTELEGRNARAGHWGDGVFRVLAPRELHDRTGGFEIVEGLVVSATVNKGRAYTVLWRKFRK